MQRLTAYLLAGTTFAAAAAAATSYYMGGKIQQAVIETATRWGNDQEVSVQLVDYQRGIFTSSARSIWSFEGDTDSYEVPVTHSIQHGPFPYGYAAQVHSVFHLPEQTSATLRQALEGKEALRWTAQVQWNQATKHTIAADAFQANFQDGSSLAWGGLQGQWLIHPDGTHIEGNVFLPHLALQTPLEHLQLHELHLQFDHTQALTSSLWTGPLQVTLKQIKADTITAPLFSAKQLQLKIDSHVAGNLAGFQIASTAQQVSLHSQNAHDGKINIEIKNIDSDWLSQALSWLNSSESEEEMQTWSLINSLPELWAGHPEIHVSNFTLQTVEGSHEISAHLSYAGKDPHLFALNDIHGQLRATLPRTSLASLLGQRVRKDYVALLESMGQQVNADVLATSIQDGVTKRLESLVEYGAIQETDDSFTSELKFNSDGFELNGKPTKLYDLLMLGEAI